MPYMIGAEPELLAELARELHDDPDVTIRRTVGKPDRPSLLAVDMTPARAEALKARYGSSLTIEPDSPVELY
jgi:hypothetical protein